MIAKTRIASLRVYGIALLMIGIALLGGCSLKSEALSQHDQARADVGSAIQSDAFAPQRIIAQGCSASGEPVHNAVEQAAGVVALIALVLGLRRRFAGRNDATKEARPRERFYSIP